MRRNIQFILRVKVIPARAPRDPHRWRDPELAAALTPTGFSSVADFCCTSKQNSRS